MFGHGTASGQVPLQFTWREHLRHQLSLASWSYRPPQLLILAYPSLCLPVFLLVFLAVPLDPSNSRRAVGFLLMRILDFMLTGCVHWLTIHHLPAPLPTLSQTAERSLDLDSRLTQLCTGHSPGLPQLPSHADYLSSVKVSHICSDCSDSFPSPAPSASFNT